MMNSIELISLLLALFAVLLAGGALLVQRKKSILPGNVSAEQHRFSNYAKVLENCDDVAWLFDTKSRRVFYVTPSIERMRGWAQAEFVGVCFPRTKVAWQFIKQFISW